MKLLTSTLITALVLSAISPSLQANDMREWSLAKSIYSDPKARKIGDIITVSIEEETETKKDAKSSSSKKSAMGGNVSFGHPRIDNRPTSWTNAVIPAWALDTQRSFEGSGSAQNKDTFVSAIACRVIDVLPNGNMLIEGSRSVVIQNELMKIVLTGTIRPPDIARDNTVKSANVADATIKYVSSGPIAQEQQRGLFTKLWNWVNPF